jgi:hypothetical protein
MHFQKITSKLLRRRRGQKTRRHAVSGGWLHLPTASCAALPQSPFCVSPPAFVAKTQRVYFRSPKAQWLQVLEFVVPVHQLFVLLVGTLPLWTADTTKTQPRATRSARNPEDEGSTTVAAQPATHHITEDLSLNFDLDQ